MYQVCEQGLVVRNEEIVDQDTGHPRQVPMVIPKQTKLKYLLHKLLPNMCQNQICPPNWGL